MSTKESSTTSSGIVVDAVTGQRHVPSSTRADGSKRKEIRIRPGYQPPEDVKVYKNPSAAAWQNRGKGGIPGAEGMTTGGSQAVNAASNKNAKRREAKKKAKAEEEAKKAEIETKTEIASPNGASKEEAAQAPLDPDAEKEKKARNLKKKLRQARDLRDKKDKGESLLPEQLAKIIKINELIRELDALGLDIDGETKSSV